MLMRLLPSVVCAANADATAEQDPRTPASSLAAGIDSTLPSTGVCSPFAYSLLAGSCRKWTVHQRLTHQCDLDVSQNLVRTCRPAACDGGVLADALSHLNGIIERSAQNPAVRKADDEPHVERLLPDRRDVPAGLLRNLDLVVSCIGNGLSHPRSGESPLGSSRGHVTNEKLADLLPDRREAIPKFPTSIRSAYSWSRRTRVHLDASPGEPSRRCEFGRFDPAAEEWPGRRTEARLVRRGLPANGRWRSSTVGRGCAKTQFNPDVG